jgi:zinc protease
MFKKLVLLALFGFASSAQAALNIQHWTLENGARVYFVENHSIPMLDVSVEFDAGSRRDPTAQSGLAALTNGMLARGVAQAKLADGSVEAALSEAELSDALADIAAQRVRARIAFQRRSDRRGLQQVVIGRTDGALDVG